MVFLWKVREKGKGLGIAGGGVGIGKGTGKSMLVLCQNYPLANDPLVFPEKRVDLELTLKCRPVIRSKLLKT